MASPPLILDLNLIKPGRMTAPRIVGGAVEGGMTLSGLSLASDVTGGGLVAIDYHAIQLFNTVRDRLLFFNRLAVGLQGGVRTCVVPFLTDYIAPVADSVFANAFSPSSVPGDVTTSFSDGSTFSDGSKFAQPLVSGAITATGAAGDGTVTLTVIGGRALQGGEWFGLQHATKSYRAYCVTDVDAQSVDGNGVCTATVGIRPTLRDAAPVGMTVSWWRPRCLMRIKSGMDALLDVSGFWMATPSLSFIEAP